MCGKWSNRTLAGNDELMAVGEWWTGCALHGNPGCTVLSSMPGVHWRHVGLLSVHCTHNVCHTCQSMPTPNKPRHIEALWLSWSVTQWHDGKLQWAGNCDHGRPSHESSSHRSLVCWPTHMLLLWWHGKYLAALDFLVQKANMVILTRLRWWFWQSWDGHFDEATFTIFNWEVIASLLNTLNWANIIMVNLWHSWSATCELWSRGGTLWQLDGRYAWWSKLWTRQCLEGIIIDFQTAESTHKLVPG